MTEKVEISRTQLWKIAQKITEFQKKASEMTEQQKKVVSWKTLEGDWFDYLEEELIGSDEESELTA